LLYLQEELYGSEDEILLMQVLTDVGRNVEKHRKKRRIQSEKKRLEKKDLQKNTGTGSTEVERAYTNPAVPTMNTVREHYIYIYMGISLSLSLSF
jgi:hypothetical protein